MKNNQLILAGCKGITQWLQIRQRFPQASAYEVCQATLKAMEEDADTRELAILINTSYATLDQSIRQAIKDQRAAEQARTTQGTTDGVPLDTQA